MQVRTGREGRQPRRGFIAFLSLFLCVCLGVPVCAHEENSSFASLCAQTAGDRGEKTVALTFDDGPHPVYTEEILELLDLYGIKATFFCIGVNAESHPEIVRRIAEGGHCIGNHTYTHPKMRNIDGEALASEIESAEELIFSICGVRPVFFRPPEGYLGKTVSSTAEKEGYSTVLWNVDTLDWTGAGCESIVKTVLKNVKDGSIILCHDYVSGKSHTAEALGKIIPELIAQGYRFVTVEELVRA